MLPTQQNMSLFYEKALEILSLLVQLCHTDGFHGFCQCSLFGGENVSPL